MEIVHRGGMAVNGECPHSARIRPASDCYAVKIRRTESICRLLAALRETGLQKRLAF
jgi:hypothetical protein